MRLEPKIDRQQLDRCLLTSYGLRARALRYIPQGEVSYNYLLTAQDTDPQPGKQATDRRYLLKLLDSSRLAGLAEERMRVAIPLLDEFHRRKLLINVPQPVFTATGEPMGSFGAFTTVLLVYVPGETPDQTTLHRPEVWAQLARDVARLHAATGAVKTACPFEESYQLPFERDLIVGMQELQNVPSGARAGIRELQRLLVPRFDEVRQLLASTKHLAAVARGLAPHHVLCHTDIHAMNLVIDEKGVLTLLDWEGVTLAPAEHDLFAFTGEDFPEFLEAYVRGGGVRQLHADVFAYYLHRRNLEDMTDWLVRILHENDSPIQDEVDLAGLKSDCIDGWPYLARASERIRHQLANLNAA